MAALIDIKRRMTGIEDLKKITGTMHMVSSIRFKTAQKEITYINNFIEKLRGIMIKIPFKPCNMAGLPVFIVMGSDRGLAGGYNSNLIERVYEEIRKYEYPKIITLGRRVEKFFTKTDMNILKSFTNLDGQLPLEVIDEIMGLVIKEYKNDSQVYIAYTHFAGVSRLEPKLVKVLPYSSSEEDMSYEYIFEPSPEELLELLMGFYLKMSIKSFYIHSYVSEQAARMVTMENAMENADELLEDLETLYHQQRKDIITGEIAEIVSGAEGIGH